MNGSDEANGDTIPAGQRLVRVDGDKGLSLAEKLAAHFHRLSYRTIFHRMRLKGRFPLKLVAVPRDPFPGDPSAGQALLHGRLTHAGYTVQVQALRSTQTSAPLAWREWWHEFSWLRDLACAADRARGAKIAEPLVQSWLADFAEFDEFAWRPDLLGTRILFWTAYAPYILSASDLVYRSAVLNHIARGARHLERSVDKTPEGLPRVRAIVGLITAGLLIPGGDARQARGEAALAKALDGFVLPDGGVTSRAPLDQLELLELLILLQSVYEVRKLRPADTLNACLARLVPALKGVTLGDGALSVLHGGSMSTPARVERAIELSGIMARPVRNGVNSGYQRLAGGKTVLVLDAGPPPVARASSSAHAGTLAFELSDGPHRLIVNCGGARGLPQPMPDELAGLLRMTAAHSTLVLADTNSTRIREDGTLGRGIEEVVAHRHESEEGTWIDVAHDGYMRRFGLEHRRRVYLSGDGSDLRGEDTLAPAKRSRRLFGRGQATRFDVRFHLGAGVEATPTADGQGALLKLPDGRVWAFKARGGSFSIDDSLWVDGEGRPRPTHQLVISGEAPAGGASVNWSLKRASR